MTLCYRYALCGEHGVTGQEIQEYPVQNETTVIHIPTETTPFVTQEIRDKGMTEELDTLLRDLNRKEKRRHATLNGRYLYLVGFHF